MAKIKALPASLREKKRYVKYRLISEKPVDPQKVYPRLKAGIERYLGQAGVGKAGILIMGETYDDKEQSGIIRVGHKYVNELKAALTFITEIDQKVIVKSVATSGTLKKARRMK